MNSRLRLSNVLIKERLHTALKANLPLLGILIGSVLVTVSTGEFTNFDSHVEFQAASGVIKWGMPYITFGNFLNEPPVGFYIDALFFTVFNLSYATGVAVITLFGIGCTFLVYKIGSVVYGKRTGLFAAAVFALTPWHVVLSRFFLIDAQCLFFSLLFLFVGIVAIRRGSWRLLLLSGVFFGVALSTKLFAVFMFILLALYFLWHAPRKIKFMLASPIFFLPAFLFSYLWYEIISGRGFLAILNHDDFTNFNPSGINPSPFFVGNYFLGALGMFFLIAAALSLFVSLFQRKFFAEFFSFELICVATIAVIVGLHTELGFCQNMSAPYVSAIKYDYQLLPLFCFLTASLAKKCRILFEPTVRRSKKNRLFLVMALSGLVLLVGSMMINMRVLNTYVTKDFIIFYVEGDVGFSFDNVALPAVPVYSLVVQEFGFALIAFSLLWANRNTLSKLTKRFFKKEKPQPTKTSDNC